MFLPVGWRYCYVYSFVYRLCLYSNVSCYVYMQTTCLSSNKCMVVRQSPDASWNYRFLPYLFSLEDSIYCSHNFHCHHEEVHHCDEKCDFY